MAYKMRPLGVIFVCLIILTGYFERAGANTDITIAATSYVDGAIALAEKTENKNAPDGYAGLDGQGNISVAQIPTDSRPAEGSENMVSSGAVWAEINAAWNDRY